MAFYKTSLEMNKFLEELLERFAKEGRSNLHQSISITWVSYKGKNPKAQTGVGAGWLNQKLIYPASVVKLVYACAIEDWINKDLLVDCPELRRAQANMIVHSSNDATSYIVDLLTGTTSGPFLREERWTVWKQQRNLVNNWLKSLEWPEFEIVNCSQKTWEDGPYGRDRKFYGEQNQNRNLLTTSSVARLLEAIMTNNFLTASSCKRLKNLLFRSLDIYKRKADPYNQIDGFLGEGLPKGSQIWSKAGLMSEARHDATWFITPNKNTMLLIVFCKGRTLAKDNSLLPSISYEISKWSGQ